MELKEFKHYIFGSKQEFASEISSEFASQVFTEALLDEKSRQFMNVPIDNILMVLERTSKILCDFDGKYYKKAMQELPEHLQYSPEMVTYGFNAFRSSNSRSILKRMLKQIGPDYHCLDYYVSLRHAQYQRAIPMGTVCHVAAGNIFLGSVGSLIQGIITKNVNILKVSSQDFLFPSMFMEALVEADEHNEIVPYIAMTYWSRDNKGVENIIKQVSDLILLFGGEDTVKQYKNGLAAKAEVLAFGPKISYGIVSRGLSDEQLSEAAKGFAHDIVLWEQRACTSCQNIFIEEDARNDAFIKHLNIALENEAGKFPQSSLNIDTAIELCKEREILKWKEFNGQLKMIEGKKAFHTVIVQQSADIIDSPLNRTIFVNIVKDYTDILKGNLSRMKYYMSTLSVASFDRMQQITEDFMQMGVMRFVKPGLMSSGRNPEHSHDGKMILQNLVRLMNYENLPSEKFGLENISGQMKDNFMLAKINDIMLTAIAAPFYSQFYENLTLPLKNLDEFYSVPTLEKTHMFECSVDENFRLATEKPDHCYVFASGGTTNRPKFLLYSVDEFEESKRIFGQGFRASGVNETDVVANYLKAGGLYTGFLVVNSGLEETGCRIVSLSCNQSVDQTIEYLKTFKPNVILGFPSGLIRLAEACEQTNANIEFEKVFYAGEYISQADIDSIIRVFKVKIFKSFGYAAVETGPIGYQCDHCKGTEHHVAEDWCRVDINDSKEVLVTVFGRKLFPVIKYNVGDLAEWVNEPCDCGRTSPRLRLLDRSAKCIVLPASSISFQDITNVSGKFTELTSIYQAVINEDDEKFVNITVFIETRIPEYATNESLRKKIELAFNEQIHALRDYREANKINDFMVVLLPPGGIMSVERTSKTKRIIDNRK
jgi:phenylacetate-coenzyme A ligase PaaK-like adenylate-forming protein